MKGEHNNENDCFHYYCYYGDVHADLLYVHDFPHIFIWQVLHMWGKTPYRMIWMRNDIALNREPFQRSRFIILKAGNTMENYFEKLVRANFRFGRMWCCISLAI